MFEMLFGHQQVPRTWTAAYLIPGHATCWQRVKVQAWVLCSELGVPSATSWYSSRSWKISWKATSLCISLEIVTEDYSFLECVTFGRENQVRLRFRDNLSDYHISYPCPVVWIYCLEKDIVYRTVAHIKKGSIQKDCTISHIIFLFNANIKSNVTVK